MNGSNAEYTERMQVLKPGYVRVTHIDALGSSRIAVVVAAECMRVNLEGASVPQVAHVLRNVAISATCRCN